MRLGHPLEICHDCRAYYIEIVSKRQGMGCGRLLQETDIHRSVHELFDDFISPLIKIMKADTRDRHCFVRY